jgi:hypothetical protein
MEFAVQTDWGPFPDAWGAETFARIWTRRDEYATS